MINQKKAKMKTPEQTIGLRAGNFLKRENELYKSEKLFNKQTKGISLKNNNLRFYFLKTANELKKMISPITSQ